MTSDDAPETLLRAIRQQAHQFVHKPVEPAGARVSSCAKRSRPRPSADRSGVGAARLGRARRFPARAKPPIGCRASWRTSTPICREDVRESVGYAFRELLLNAVEWGGKLDPKRKVRISYLRAKRMLLYRIADPGPGSRWRSSTTPRSAIPTTRSST